MIGSSSCCYYGNRRSSVLRGCSSGVVDLAVETWGDNFADNDLWFDWADAGETRFDLVVISVTILHHQLFAEPQTDRFTGISKRVFDLLDIVKFER